MYAKYFGLESFSVKCLMGEGIILDYGYLELLFILLAYNYYSLKLALNLLLSFH